MEYATYDYDVNGIRTRKELNESGYIYYTQNGKLMREVGQFDGVTKRQVIDFIYDESGCPFALNYSPNGDGNFTLYYYILNLQGDVVKLVTASGETVASYEYDAWGKVLKASGNMALMNPLRYRGYYYDNETGFYYLQSRYYDPVNRRFINADTYASTDSSDAIACNMFAYCANNPIINADPSGEFLITTLILIGAGIIAGGVAVYTGYKAREAGCDWGDTLFYAIGSGLCTFATVYTLGTTAYGAYANYCAINAITPVTEVGPSGNGAASMPSNPLESITYSDKVQAQRANSSDVYHSFPDIVDNYGAYGTQRTLTGNDGQSYTQLLIPGYYHGKAGNFSYIWNAAGVCNHRLFEMTAQSQLR